MIGNPQLAKDVEIREVGAPVAAGSSIDNNSDRIDMSNYEGVIFITPITDSVDTGVATQVIQQNTADSDSGMAAISDTSATVTSAANDDLNGQLLVSSVHRPRERYVQRTLTSATANIAYGNTIAILYGKRVKPVTDHSTVSDSAHAVSPAES